MMILSIIESVVGLTAVVLTELQIIRLRLERFFALSFGRRRRYRVMATACWSFPIYSQTFVYQELTQLIRQEFDVRFLYFHQDSRSQLPGRFRPLWNARRRVILHPTVCKQALNYFKSRYPEKIREIVDILCKSSGLLREQLLDHPHLWQAFSFARMVEAYRPDYLHSYFFYEGTLFSFVASFMLGIPRGVSCYSDHLLKDYLFKMVPIHLQQCSIIVSTSERIREELLELAPGADPARIIVKPNAIDTTEFPVVTCTEPEQGQPFRLVSVNRIEPKKGLIYLTEAIHILRGRNLNAELHVIGGVDDNELSRSYCIKLNALIEELNLADLIHLEGFKPQSEIKSIFCRSHLFVAPFVETEYGDKDGIPTSLLEAMASGLPVIATDAGSIREVVRNGKNAMVVSQRDPVALADAISTLIGDPVLRTRLGMNAAKEVRGQFDVSGCEHIFHGRLRQVLNSSWNQMNFRAELQSGDQPEIQRGVSRT